MDYGDVYKTEYAKLIKKISHTSNIIESLARIESDFICLVDEGQLDKQVLDLLGKCIDDINKIYINNTNKIASDTPTPHIIDNGTQNKEL